MHCIIYKDPLKWKILRYESNNEDVSEIYIAKAYLVLQHLYVLRLKSLHLKHFFEIFFPWQLPTRFLCCPAWGLWWHQHFISNGFWYLRNFLLSNQHRRVFWNFFWCLWPEIWQNLCNQLLILRIFLWCLVEHLGNLLSLMLLRFSLEVNLWLL